MSDRAAYLARYLSGGAPEGERKLRRKRKAPSGLRVLDDDEALEWRHVGGTKRAAREAPEDEEAPTVVEPTGAAPARPLADVGSWEVVGGRRDDGDLSPPRRRGAVQQARLDVLGVQSRCPLLHRPRSFSRRCAGGR